MRRIPDRTLQSLAQVELRLCETNASLQGEYIDASDDRLTICNLTVVL
jgi:hypothetical protein